MTQLHQSKVFANGSTTLPKPVREALGVKAGDNVRYVFAEDRVLVLREPSDEPGVKVPADDADLRKALGAAEKVMDENHTLLRKLK